MTLIQGVDASFDDVSAAEAQRLKASGVEVFAQCLWTGAAQPPPRVTNLRNTHNAGLAVAGYISLSGARNGGLHIDDGRAGVPDDLWAALKFVAVDVELAGIPNTAIAQALARCVELGKRRVIYTSYGHWTAHQGNTTQFNNALLWNALWDQQPDVDYPALQYGGWRWDFVIGEQWSGGSNVQGVFADRNTFVRELVDPALAPPAPHPPTSGEFAALAGFVNSLRLRVDALERKAHTHP